MADIRRKTYHKKALEDAILKGDIEALGRVAMDMMQDIERVYDEAGVEDGDSEEYLAHSFTSGNNYEGMYNDLRLEYQRRFANLPEEGESFAVQIPQSQPAADDINIGVNPHTGQVVTVIGDGVEEMVSEEDIFGRED